MSAIKNHFHEEITKDQDDMIDDSYRYEKWKEEQNKQRKNKPAGQCGHTAG